MFSAGSLRGPDGLEFWLQGIILKVASESTRYLSLVNSSMREINLALVGKCIAMAVACVGMAAEPKVVWRLVSFLTKHRAKHTCEPCGHSSCEIYRCHYQGFGRKINQCRKGGNFWSRRCHSFCRLTSHCGEQGSYCAESRRL